MPITPDQETVRLLSDMYSVEQQALAQLVEAPGLAGDPQLEAMFRQHHPETEGQAERMGSRLKALGGSPSALKDAVMRLGGKGFLLFARAQPETPGRLVAHSYAFEAMEWAGYEMLRHVAEAAGDAPTARLAEEIGAQEREMMERLELGFDAAARASHAGTPARDLPEQIRKHLAEAHALEGQGEQLLKKSETIGGGEPLASLYDDWLASTRRQRSMVEDRLRELGGEPSGFKDAAMKLGAVEWGLFFQAQSDTAPKLAAFVYAFEHLKIAGYELLRRTSGAAGDAQTAALCHRLIEGERAFADRLTAAFESAVAEVVG